MNKKVNCIMLIDDDENDNYFHERVIRKNNSADMVIKIQSGKEAFEYLKKRNQQENAHPDLIFLDINMPGMNGWEFIAEYNKLAEESQSKIVVIMLTTSESPGDRAKAKTFNLLSDFKTKPLTKEMLNEIMDEYF